MSSMLKQAIIDATALKEAALKNAEQSILEKYSKEVKKAVSNILEQEDPLGGEEGGEAAADPLAGGETPMEGEEESPFEEDNLSGKLSPYLLMPLSPFYRYLASHIAEQLTRIPIVIMMLLILLIGILEVLMCFYLKQALMLLNILNGIQNMLKNYGINVKLG